LVTAVGQPFEASTMIHTFSVVSPVALELVVDFDEDEQAEATSATDAVAHASATSFLRFTTFLRWTVSGSHRWCRDLGHPELGRNPIRCAHAAGSGGVRGGSRTMVRVV
jgi:hypothetical protein